MNKVKKILIELRGDYIRKRDCLIGTNLDGLSEDQRDKINFKIKNLTIKIEEINDAMMLDQEAGYVKLP